MLATVLGAAQRAKARHRLITEVLKEIEFQSVFFCDMSDKTDTGAYRLNTKATH